jgi:hypothetical protein
VFHVTAVEAQIFVCLPLEVQIAIQRLEQRGCIWGEHFATREAVEMAEMLEGENDV